MPLPFSLVAKGGMIVKRRCCMYDGCGVSRFVCGHAPPAAAVAARRCVYVFSVVWSVLNIRFIFFISFSLSRSIRICSAHQRQRQARPQVGIMLAVYQPLSICLGRLFSSRKLVAVCLSLSCVRASRVSAEEAPSWVRRSRVSAERRCQNENNSALCVVRRSLETADHMLQSRGLLLAEVSDVFCPPTSWSQRMNSSAAKKSVHLLGKKSRL